MFFHTKSYLHIENRYVRDKGSSIAFSLLWYSQKSKHVCCRTNGQPNPEHHRAQMNSGAQMATAGSYGHQGSHWDFIRVRESLCLSMHRAKETPYSPGAINMLCYAFATPSAGGTQVPLMLKSSGLGSQSPELIPRVLPPRHRFPTAESEHAFEPLGSLGSYKILIKNNV